MDALSCLPGCSRKAPTQRRGEERVAALLDAAVGEFAARGYESATMSSIARKAASPIGSLYQFFPNKEALARALRTRQIMDAERIWAGLEHRAATGSLEAFIRAFVARMIEFIDEHPAFLPLLDAPPSTLPVGPRNRLRQRMETMLRAMRPRLREASGIAEVVLNLNKSMMSLYARSGPGDRARVAVEYRTVLGAYLGSRLGPAPAKPRRARERREA